MSHRARTRAVVAAFVAVFGLAACSGGDTPPSAETPQNNSIATAQLSPAPTSDTPTPTTAPVSVRLVWSHTGKFFDETQVWYVARVTNANSSPAKVTLDALALDAEGVIVGSSEDTLPTIPGNNTFDYFGYLGGGGALNTKLTGTPAKIQVTQKPRTTQGDFPILKTSGVRLAAGHEPTYTDAPLSYNLSARVTNTTGFVLVGGVTQQTVLYDSTGKVVGGDTGTSDNVPESLPVGLSYREAWTGMPALIKATRAAYTVWPGAPVG
ncbi:hypothetical protein OHA18_17980 [Kribbella sp. NBC_00709]|uniref:hypothetical protein n=1 Tax=Kribbella sp. NBC_00709 TaxID=2975972 RepID=UPI002E2B25FB|nr:hypothetical protein [Kribbella sp. NBC_00709]